MKGKELQKVLNRSTLTHFFIVFDFIFRDDTIGLLGFLPGELDAALLHFFLDDLADLGRSCLERNMSISGGQTRSGHTRLRQDII